MPTSTLLASTTALQVENRNQTLMIALNVNKDASQDPIGKYWIEDRTDPMNPKAPTNWLLCFAFGKTSGFGRRFFLTAAQIVGPPYPIFYAIPCAGTAPAPDDMP